MKTVGTICIFESEQTQSLNVTEAYSIDIFRVASGRIWHCSLVVVHYRLLTPHYSFSNLIVLSIDFPVLYTIVRTPSLRLKLLEIIQKFEKGQKIKIKTSQK